MLVPPAVALWLADPDGFAKDDGCETEKFSKEFRLKDQVIVAVYSFDPRHYSFLQVIKSPASSVGYLAVFKDSMKPGAPTALLAAKTILVNLGLGALAEGLEPTNADHQPDGWSCGLYVLKWAERALRETAGEARIPDVSQTIIIKRTNEFINKRKHVSVPRGQGKAKAKPKGQAAKKLSDEPTFESLEDALAVAQECSKCMPTLKGTKGCHYVISIGAHADH